MVSDSVFAGASPRWPDLDPDHGTGSVGDGSIVGGSSPGAVHSTPSGPPGTARWRGRLPDEDLTGTDELSHLSFYNRKPSMDKGPSADMKHIKRTLVHQLKAHAPGASTEAAEAFLERKGIQVSAGHGEFRDNGYGFYCTTIRYTITVPGENPGDDPLATFNYESTVDLWVPVNKPLTEVETQLSERTRAHALLQSETCTGMANREGRELLKARFGIQASQAAEGGQVIGQSRGSKGSVTERIWAKLPRTAKAGTPSHTIVSAVISAAGTADNVAFYGALSLLPRGSGEAPPAPRLSSPDHHTSSMTPVAQLRRGLAMAKRQALGALKEGTVNAGELTAALEKVGTIRDKARASSDNGSDEVHEDARKLIEQLRHLLDTLQEARIDADFLGALTRDQANAVTVTGGEAKIYVDQDSMEIRMIDIDSGDRRDDIASWNGSDWYSAADDDDDDDD